MVANDMSKFTPCPFCGGTHFRVVYFLHGPRDAAAWGECVKCNTCGAQAPDTVWNQRSGMAEKDAEKDTERLDWLENRLRSYKTVTFKMHESPGIEHLGTPESSVRATIDIARGFGDANDHQGPGYE